MNSEMTIQISEICSAPIYYVTATEDTVMSETHGSKVNYDEK